MCCLLKLSPPVTHPAEMLNGANSVSSFGFSMAQNFSAYLTLVFVVLLPRVQLRYKVEQLMSFLCFLPVGGLLRLRMS